MCHRQHSNSVLQTKRRNRAEDYPSGACRSWLCRYRELSQISNRPTKRIGKETINRNNDIAVDRQIVERYFGIFKGMWGITKDCYRGDRRALPLLIRGLVALTNYYIDQNLLSEGDEFYDPLRFSVPSQ